MKNKEKECQESRGHRGINSAELAVQQWNASGNQEIPVLGRS